MTTKKKDPTDDAGDAPATDDTTPPAPDGDQPPDVDEDDDSDEPAAPPHTPTDLGVPAERFQ